MCGLRRRSQASTVPSAAAQVFAAPDNREAIRQGDIEARLRSRRGGAAANILTSPRGIPATDQLGRVAA